MSDARNDPPGPVDETDRQAARSALARNWPDLDQASEKYGPLLEALAEFHRHFGSERFELRYNLRPPRDRAEDWTRQCMHGQITEEELRDRLKADAERPIDLEMLTSFSRAYQDRLADYSAVLRNAARRPHEIGTSAWREHEETIDRHVAALNAKFPLWRENIETVHELLDEIRVTSGVGMVTAGDIEATSAHWLVELVFTRTTEAWRSCKDISTRSQRDPRYLYKARAADLFCQTWLPQLPSPQNLSERLREEFIMAKVALKNAMQAAADPLRPRPAPSNEWSIDNQSRELGLIGDMFSIVAAAGHIFRPTPNSDCGIDGEIEFKDAAYRASGQRVYVQLKSGESHLTRRKGDGEEIFSVTNPRHLQYWAQQAYPVMLVIRQSNGSIRWMDVSAYLKKNDNANRQIVFRGSPLSPETVRQLADKLHRPRPDGDSDNTPT